MIRFLKDLDGITPIRTWAMFLAGPWLLLFSVGLVWIVWKGPWPAHEAGRQLDILGKALWISLGLDGVIVVALAAAKVRGQTMGGASFEIESGNVDAPRPAAVTTTTTTELKP